MYIIKYLIYSDKFNFFIQFSFNLKYISNMKHNDGGRVTSTRERECEHVT